MTASRFALVLPLLLAAGAPLVAQAPGMPATDAAPPTIVGYADLVDRVLASPIVADVTVRSASRIKGAEAAGLAPDSARFYVEADVTALVRSPGALPPRVGYLVDVPLGASGRVPKLRRQRALIFARPVNGNQLQLVAPDAQEPWTPALDAAARRVVGQVLAADAPPAITGVGNAFHVAGSLPGEGETQIFLNTADNRPVSLSVLRRPGEEPRWAVALSEIVDDAAGSPAPDTLLWYRLACGLPRTLPTSSTSELEGNDADAARADYRFVLQKLGPCGRTTG